jgi:phosphate starvation-inducible membrane PsiE
MGKPSQCNHHDGHLCRKTAWHTGVLRQSAIFQGRGLGPLTAWHKRHVRHSSSFCRIGESNIVNTKWADKLRKGLHGSADSLGNLCVEAFHYLALFGIGAITAYAAVATFIDMLSKGGISVDDILLLFIYLELGAMVGIYFKTNHMPIRFLLYVAITALTRLLIGDVSHHKAPDVGLLYVCGGILLLAFAILVVRYASYRYPSTKVLDANGKQVDESK